MRIWISTAGWRLTGTCIRLLLVCALCLPAGGNAFAKEKGKGEPPDMEMLEFLGTFETAGGKMIDPLKLPERSQSGKATAKPAPKDTPAKKTDRKIKDEKR